MKFPTFAAVLAAAVIFASPALCAAVETAQTAATQTTAPAQTTAQPAQSETTAKRPDTFGGAEMRPVADGDVDGVRYISTGGTAIVVGYGGYLPDVEIPAVLGGLPVAKIGDSAFEGKDIVSVIIPSSVSVIGEDAFEGCASLASVTLSEGLEKIGESAFEDCAMLREVTLPETLTEIGESAFEGCLLLKKLVIPAAVVYIGEDAFMSCESLTLDVSKNEYAAAYAKDHAIATSLWSSRGPYIAAAVVTVTLGAAVLVVFKVVSRRRG